MYFNNVAVDLPDSVTSSFQSEIGVYFNNVALDLSHLTQSHHLHIQSEIGVYFNNVALDLPDSVTSSFQSEMGVYFNKVALDLSVSQETLDGVQAFAEFIDMFDNIQFMDILDGELFGFFLECSC